MQGCKVGAGRAQQLRSAPRRASLRSGATRGSVRVRAILTEERKDLDVSKMAPLGDRVLVRPQESEKVTAGGILLPTAAGGGGGFSSEEGKLGTVVAVGEDVDCGVAAGDRVLFSKYGVSDIEAADGDVCFVAQKSILAKLS